MATTTPADMVEHVVVVPCSQESEQLTPCPSTTTSSSTGSPSPEAAPTAVAEKKKREPKPREPPQTIDLRASVTSDPAQQAKQKKAIDRLVKALRKKKKIVVIAGAGISVSSGIPDFRSAAGLFSTLKSDNRLKASGKDLFDASVYKDDDATSSFHTMVRDLHAMVQKAQPSAFHHLLASLASEGRLLRLYTQNVDCIETSMEPLKTAIPLQRKGPWPRTVQLHGALETMVCSRCKWAGRLDPSLFDGPAAPDCGECKEMDSVRGLVGKRTLGIGKLRPRMVLYNEENPDAEAIGAVTQADLKTRPDAVIVVGTSLKIPGVQRIVREMCNVARDIRGGITIWINEDEPPLARQFDGIFDLIVRGNCERVARLAALPRFDGSSLPSEDEEASSDISSKQTEASVVVDNSSTGLVTPLPSPHHSIISTLSSDQPQKPKAKRKSLPKSDSKPKTPKKQRIAKSLPTTPRISEKFKATKIMSPSMKGSSLKQVVPESPDAQAQSLESTSLPVAAAMVQRK